MVHKLHTVWLIYKRSPPISVELCQVQVNKGSRGFSQAISMAWRMDFIVMVCNNLGRCRDMLYYMAAIQMNYMDRLNLP